ncbi:hypothetical protein EPYR_03366 [Erwinia pyrifoliae DSM 12163]|nr:hypothetical protein EPYR_03366 [Erwinia pyrifoliae DSM 12163]
MGNKAKQAIMAAMIYPSGCYDDYHAGRCKKSRRF